MSDGMLGADYPMQLAPTATAPAPHPLLDGGGISTLLILFFAFIAPTVAWVIWGQSLKGLPAGAIEMRMLLWSALLAMVLPVLKIVMHIRRFGGSLIRGNRDAYPRAAGVDGRIARAHANMVESLVPFVAVTFSVHAAGISNRWTASVGWVSAA